MDLDLNEYIGILYAHMDLKDRDLLFHDNVMEELTSEMTWQWAAPSPILSTALEHVLMMQRWPVAILGDYSAIELTHEKAHRV